MRGLELPVNVLILLAIAVIVLLGVVTLFFGGFGGPSGVISLQTVTSTACAEWRNKNFQDARGIHIKNFDADKDQTLDFGSACDQDNLETLGQYYYNTGTCADLIGSNEQAIRTGVCGFP